MPQVAAKKRGSKNPPGGLRAGGVEVQRRLDRADELLRAGSGRADVIAALAGEFGISVRAADEYIARVRQRWTEESTGRREVDRQAALHRLATLSAKAERRGAFAAAVSAEKLKAQISGLLAPVEIMATVEQPSHEPELTMEEALAELEGLDAIIRQARRRIPVGNGDAALLDG